MSKEKVLVLMGGISTEREISLKSGNAVAKAWGCDLTYDYVKINGDYRT